MLHKMLAPSRHWHVRSGMIRARLLGLQLLPREQLSGLLPELQATCLWVVWRKPVGIVRLGLHHAHAIITHHLVTSPAMPRAHLLAFMRVTM